MSEPVLVGKPEGGVKQPNEIRLTLTLKPLPDAKPFLPVVLPGLIRFLDRILGWQQIGEPTVEAI